jgi:hypothetical protein
VVATGKIRKPISKRPISKTAQKKFNVWAEGFNPSEFEYASDVVTFVFVQGLINPFMNLSIGFAGSLHVDFSMFFDAWHRSSSDCLLFWFIVCRWYISPVPLKTGVQDLKQAEPFTVGKGHGANRLFDGHSAHLQQPQPFQACPPECDF